MTKAENGRQTQTDDVVIEHISETLGIPIRTLQLHFLIQRGLRKLRQNSLNSEMKCKDHVE